jgi:hypothetical protein
LVWWLSSAEGGASRSFPAALTLLHISTSISVYV